MIWKVVSILLMVLMILFSVVFVFDNLPGKPVELKVNYLEPESDERIEYGAVPIFAENMRFNHDLISYSIGDDCDESRRADMIRAFNIFSDKVDIVSFYEFFAGVDANESADVKVGCSDEFIDLGEELFAAGEGGPSRIVNTSGFKVIEEGKIILYNSRDCDYPTVALHELGHVFGFDHSEDPKNIMHATSGCDQRISDDMIELIQNLYSIEPLPDARADGVEGVVKGKYLNFNISVLNEGLTGIDSINLNIFADGKEVDVVEMGKIEIGFGRTLKVENMVVPRNVETLKFVLDYEDMIQELDESNNAIELTI